MELWNLISPKYMNVLNLAKKKKDVDVREKINKYINVLTVRRKEKRF